MAALSPEHLERLLADLDHRRFAVRQKAAAELETLAEAVAPLLRQRAERGSAEVRRALRDILAGIDGFPPKRLRQVRAVEALEWMATPEALRFLEELAAGAPSARLTRDAAASRDRLRQLR